MNTPPRRRALGFLRSLGGLHARVGWRGVVELVAARAMPATLSYQRIRLIDAPATGGELTPELEPRRLVASEPEVEAFFARLAASAEPEVPAFSPDDLARRFAAGHELWLFHVAGRIAHARFIVADALRFAGVSIRLAPGERATEGMVTVPEHRKRGLNLMARNHVRAALSPEGMTRLFSVMHGFNRRLVATTLAIPGARELATVHVIALGNRRWLRIVPASPAAAALIESRGMRTGRWLRQPEVSETVGASWDRAATRTLARPYLDPQMAEVKRRAHLELLDRWLPDLHSASVLKTDLWEEGIAGDELLFTLARQARRAYGTDVSTKAISLASRAAAEAGVNPRMLRGDLRELPFGDGEIDVIVSTSTLDHLASDQRMSALAELRRVLSDDGVLVITCDNADNVTDALLGLAARLRLIPFPLGPSMSAADLQELLVLAGFDCSEHAYLVPGPRVITTACVRALRTLPGGWGERGVALLLRSLAAVGVRAPRRTGAFVALRATPARLADFGPDGVRADDRLEPRRTPAAGGPARSAV